MFYAVKLLNRICILERSIGNYRNEKTTFFRSHTNTFSCKMSKRRYKRYIQRAKKSNRYHLTSECIKRDVCNIREPY